MSAITWVEIDGVRHSILPELGLHVGKLIAERDALKALNAELVEALERVSAIYGMNSARMAPMIAGNDQMEPLMVHVSAILLKASK